MLANKSARPTVVNDEREIGGMIADNPGHSGLTARRRASAQEFDLALDGAPPANTRGIGCDQARGGVTVITS